MSQRVSYINQREAYKRLNMNSRCLGANADELKNKTELPKTRNITLSFLISSFVRQNVTRFQMVAGTQLLIYS